MSQHMLYVTYYRCTGMKLSRECTTHYVVFESFESYSYYTQP